MGLKKCPFPPKVQIFLKEALLTDPSGAKRYGIQNIIREQFGKNLLAKNLWDCTKISRDFAKNGRGHVIFNSKKTRNLKFNLGPYAGVDYNLTLCPLQSRIQHIYPMGNPMPVSTFFPSQGLWIWPLSYHHMYTVLCFGQ